MAVTFNEKRPFGIPVEDLTKPIDPLLLNDLGMPSHVDQQMLLASPVLVRGRTENGGTRWQVAASSARLEEIDTTDYGRVNIESDTPLTPPNALDHAHEWIKGSPTTLFMLSDMKRIQVPQYETPSTVSGIVLVRARDLSNPKHLPR